jgi:hypothetical protein
MKHLLLGSKFLLSKSMQPLLRNAFANKHVPTGTIGVQQYTVLFEASGQQIERGKLRNIHFWEPLPGKGW